MMMHEQVWMPAVMMNARCSSSACRTCSVLARVAVCLALLIGVTGVRAAEVQPTARPRAAQDATLLLPERPLQDALNESMVQSRLLVVVTSPTREKEKANRELWAQPVLREWVRWHAVLVHVKDRELLETLRQAGLVIGVPDQPLLFKSGKQERIFGSQVREDNGAPAGSRLRAPPPPLDERGRRMPLRADRPDPAVRLMLRLEWTRLSLVRNDADWARAHLRNNPEPEPPKVPYVYQGISDRLDPALGDPAPDPAAPAASVPDPVARWIKLVRSTRAGADRGAAGAEEGATLELITWLWERGTQHQACFPGVAFSTLAREWHMLAQSAPAARARARAMRDATATLLPWMGPDGWFEWLMLSRVADEHLEVIDLIDAALDDPDARAMFTPEQRASWESMLPWLNWVEPAQLPGAEGNPMVPLRRLRDKLAERRAPQPAGAEGAERDHLREFLAWLARVEGSRLYAAFLRLGDNAHAAQAADIVREVAGPFDAARWLTTAALCEGQPRQEQAEWLGGHTDMLGARLLATVRAELANSTHGK